MVFPDTVMAGPPGLTVLSPMMNALLEFAVKVKEPMLITGGGMITGMNVLAGGDADRIASTGRGAG